MTEHTTRPDRNTTSAFRQEQSGRVVDAIVQEYVAEKQRDDAAFAQRHVVRKSRVLAGLLAAVALAVWIAPSFLLRNSAPAPQSRAQAEAGARVRLFLAAQRIRAEQDRTGSLPQTLASAKVNDPAMSYQQRGDSTFELRVAVDGGAVTYLSTDRDPSYLTKALADLRGTR